jgi:hypothetical protein
MGLTVWTQDEAGPYQAIPQPGHSWQPEGHPLRHPHEYIRGGTAKMMTLFHPATGKVCVKGVQSCTNAVLHPWLKDELTQILEQLPPRSVTPPDPRAEWELWQKGLTRPLDLPEDLPQLRMLLILDNLQGHKSTDLVDWLLKHGVMPLYTPVGGSWLNLTESIQNILAGRALSGDHPQNAQQIIEWLEAIARGWNQEPTVFHWGAKRAARRSQARMRRHFLARSGGYVNRKLTRNKK